MLIHIVTALAKFAEKAHRAQHPELFGRASSSASAKNQA